MSKNSQSDKESLKANVSRRKIGNDKEEGEESSDDEAQSKKQKLTQKKIKRDEDSGKKSSDNFLPKETSKKRSSKKSNDDSDSSSSSSSSEDSNDEDEISNDTDEIKLSKTKTRLVSIKQKYDEAKHKLEKIERALIKAENENNKENIVKCKKYKKLYDQKVKDLKVTLKQAKIKLDKYVEIVNSKNVKKPQIDSIQTKKQPQLTQQTNEKQTISKDSSLSLSSQKETKQTQPQTVLKLPFPVLNDTRDFQTILKTLETKYVELQNKKELNKKSINTFSLYTHDKKLMEKNQQNLDKLKQLDKSISLLIERLVKQMDYLKLSLSLESIKSRNMMGDAETVSRMTQTLGEMFNYMKNENKEYILKQKKITESGEIEAQGNQQPEESSPMIKLNELYDQVNKALTAVLAHTAACAHSSAAINAYNYSVYYQQQLNLQENPESVATSNEELEQIKPPVVPLKIELKNASNKFSLFKEKINSFFLTTKKVNNEKIISTTINSTKKDGLNKLIADYNQDEDGDDDDDDDNEDSVQISEESTLKIKQPNETKQITSKKVNLEDDEESYTEDEDDLEGNLILFNDLDKNCDLEIITTSELKQSIYNKKRNYLLPSLKAINFPLKASLSFNNPSRFIKKVPDTLIAVEKSKCGLTFLGNSNKYTNSFGQKQNRLYEILYSHQQK